METRLPCGPRIRQLMNARGFSIPELARRACVHPKTVRNALASRAVRADTLKAIARAFGTTSRALLDPELSRLEPSFLFDVAISVADEDRRYAHRLSEGLGDRGYEVFYDRDQEPFLWGKPLSVGLADVFGRLSRHCIIIVSEHYVRKRWPQWEFRCALDRHALKGDDYLLPLRLDDSAQPGLPESMVYMDLQRVSIDHVVRTFERRTAGGRHLH